jgi:hypothetical protein
MLAWHVRIKRRPSTFLEQPLSLPKLFVHLNIELSSVVINLVVKIFLIGLDFTAKSLYILTRFSVY